MSRAADRHADCASAHLPLAQLREIRGNRLYATVIELQLNLPGARADRARELTELTANAPAHVERLMFLAEGDGC